MSVLIKGMKMPKDGFITITVTSDGRVVGNSKKESGKFEYLDNPVIAKAVPVPAHKGPLVDALEVINTFPEEFIFTDEQARALTNYIITADKEGEE